MIQLAGQSHHEVNMVTISADIVFTQRHVGRTDMNGIGNLRNLACYLCFFFFFAPLFCPLRLRRTKATGRLEVLKKLPFTGTRTLVIGIRIVHILTADRRDDVHICRVRAGIGHCLI